MHTYMFVFFFLLRVDTEVKKNVGPACDLALDHDTPVAEQPKAAHTFYSTSKEWREKKKGDPARR